MHTFHATIREIAAECGAAENPELMTSKGFRMAHPTLADLRGAQWHERLALGNWKEAAGARPDHRLSVIPARYQGHRDLSAAFLKVFQWQLLNSLLVMHRSKVALDSRLIRPAFAVV